MTNQQLYLSLGIPAILILANIGIMLFLIQSLSSKIDRLDSKIDQVRFELSSRIDRVANDLTSRIDRVADATMVFYRELDRHEITLTKQDEAIKKLQQS